MADDETSSTPTEDAVTPESVAPETPTTEASAKNETVSTNSDAAPIEQPKPNPPAPSVSINIVQELLVRARAKIQEKKRKKFEKIVELVSKNGKTSNDEIERVLHVSDSTATRYLLALAKDGRVKRVGGRGKHVFYSKT